MKLPTFIAFVALLGSTIGQIDDSCSRIPSRTASSRTGGDNGFRILVSEKSLPNNYKPDEEYTVKIRGSHRHQKFSNFMLVAVAQNSKEDATIGRFKLSNDDETKFDPNCETVVTRRYPYPNRIGEIRVKWQAPPAGSGCVEFRATVVELQDIWYKDEGALTHVLCEEEEDIVTTPLPECNACGVAKYSVEFQGLWSRQTHPKDFPSGNFEPLLHWSNIVGASHSRDYSIWEHGGYSTNGVKEVCEHGQVRILEREIREHDRHVRTVIITPGLWGVTQITKKATARFSVDKRNHLMSLLAMLGPSPDWCTGVSKLNMCMPNGTWAGSQDIELYPWDAGTDSGVSYVSPNLATIPHEPIHPITNTYPDNPRSPFYGKHAVKPVAILRIRRLSPKANADDCEEDDGEDLSGSAGSDMEKKIMMDKELMMKCRASDWTEWSDCSVTCGIGMRFRMRQYLMPGVDAMCGLRMKETDKCIAPENECEESNEGICATTHYSDWAPCSVTCGKGFTMRQRMYLNPMGKLKCSKELVEKRMCVAKVESCHNIGKGKDWTAICSQPKIVGRCRAEHHRWYFDTVMGKCLPFVYGGCKGNQNRFTTQTECQDRCTTRGSIRGRTDFESTEPTPTTKRPRKNKKNRGRKKKPKTGNEIDCMVTEWTPWSSCSTTCGRGRIERIRMIKREAENGGRRCPTKLKQKRKCHLRKCPIDCQLGEWTEWTSCSQTCGADSLQERTKPVLKRPRRGGSPCGPRLERRYCLQAACP